MNLSERVDSELKTAMREKNAIKLGVLRMLKAALTNATIEKGGADSKLTDAEAAQVIRKQVKQRQDSIESFEKGGRAELAAKEKEELSILQSYLPQGMSADEISKVVGETIAEVGAIFLLFTVGLETSPKDLIRVGTESITVAIATSRPSARQFSAEFDSTSQPFNVSTC